MTNREIYFTQTSTPKCVCAHLNKKGVEMYLDDDDCYDTNNNKEKKCHNTFVSGNLRENGGRK